MASVTERTAPLQVNHYSQFPAASVSGFFFSHPASCYFNVGKIGEDQVKDYAARAGRDEEDLRRALASVL